MTDTYRLPALKLRQERELARIRDQWRSLGPGAFGFRILTIPERDRRPEDYEDFVRSGEERLGPVLGWLASRGKQIPGSRALDFGCGPGRFSMVLSDRYDSTLGLDVSEPLVGTARSLCRSGHGLKFAVNQEADLRGLGSASFDLVLCAYVLQHNPPWLSERYIHEFSRILKPGGRLVLQMHGATVNSIFRLVPPAFIYTPVNLWNSHRAGRSGPGLNQRWDTYWIRPRRIRRLLSGEGMTIEATIRESEPQGRLISYWFRAVKPPLPNHSSG